MERRAAGTPDPWRHPRLLPDVLGQNKWTRSEHIHKHPLVLWTARPSLGERPVFGQLRYMSFDGMKRKTDVAAYIREIGLAKDHTA
jgi:hypothetical protein